MSIRLIALDLDGTLLTSEKKISLANKKALEECLERNIQVVIATGRTGAGIPDEVKSIRGIRYIIGANGAVVEDIRTGLVLKKQSIPKADALKILDIVKTHPLIYDAHIDGLGKIDKRFLENLEEYVPEEEVRNLVRRTRSEITDLRSYIDKGRSDVDKINLTFKERATRELVRQRLNDMSSIVITSSFSNNLELNHRSATKGNGLLFLTSHLGLTPLETMAFGDAENDLTMLKQAGIGVAMGNALASVKAVADYVTVTNDEDGVATAISKLLIR